MGTNAQRPAGTAPSIITIAKADQPIFLRVLRRRGRLPKAWDRAIAIAKTIRSVDG
ncbi:MAG: hypothetical protein H0W41_00105 [Chloroflexi bacterium]|nr:hypothetical protein [Chloroflexota bacterium]